uniref:Retrovirus-related Pol polyprotein from transposon 17.6 n=2 Tax=Cajanus cajan TaxID=3821 RepID=A0A151SWK0_CAJCA|nr:Retrovirus-related Pol polyprotein from transposon 17.6 [Cajanus cajan]
MLQRLSAVQSWTDLKRALESQFGPSPFDFPMSELFKLQQTGTIFDYYMKFMSLANRSIGLPDEALLKCFLSGLHAEIRRDVIVQTPTSLIRAVALAKLYEERYSPTIKSDSTPVRRYSPVYSASFNTSQQQSKPVVKAYLPPLLPKPSIPPLANSQVKKISPAEMQLRREKGLFFFFDDKFTFNHKCPNRQYLFLNLEEDSVDSNIDPPPDIDQPVINTEIGIDDHHLSLNALKGGIGVGTIRFLANIDKLPVTVLIDGGSFDNFLQPRLAKFLKLPIEPAPMFKVMVGNGNYMTAEGLIQQLIIQAQGNLFQMPVYLLPISGADLILGASWLKTIDPHVANYESLHLKFLYNGKFVTLQGDVDHVPRQAHLHHIRRMVNTNSIAEVYSMKMVDPIMPSFTSLELLPDIEPEVDLLLTTYALVFSTPSKFPPPRAHGHSIPLMDGSAPVKVKPYRYPHSQKEEIEKLVAEMLHEGIIQPSKSPFSSPIILVKKKDGSWRVCTDYRALNAITIKDSFPIPTVDELIDELFGATIFSKLDLRSGYHQILLNPEDRYKNAFRTHHGHFEWLVMPFGLTNALATFQSLMNDIFHGLLRKFVLVFFDDILVYSSSLKDHLYHLEVVLQILQRQQLYARFSKCSFGVKEIDYLGHTLSGSGVAMDCNKLQAVKEWPRPINLKQLRGFLGLTGYYQRFVKGYAQIATPLTDLLKKYAFQWTVTADNAFQQLKEALTTAPVLAIPNFSVPFVLETDTSGSGVGAVLSQENHPIAYKKLSARMQNQSAYTREFYAITEALSKF